MGAMPCALGRTYLRGVVSPGEVTLGLLLVPAPFDKYFLEVAAAAWSWRE